MKRALKSATSGECVDELRESPRPFDTSLFRGLLFALRFVVSIGLILWAFRKIGLNNLIQTWGAISIGELAVAALAVVVLQCVSAVRWWVVARFTGVHFTLLQAIGAYFVGMVFNQVLPGLVGGDAVSSYLLGQRSDASSLSKILGTAYAQRAAGFVVMLVVGFASMLHIGIHRNGLLTLSLIVASVAIILATIAVALMLRGRGSSAKLLQKLGTFSDAAFSFTRSPRALLFVGSLSLFYHLGLIGVWSYIGSMLGLEANYLTFAAMGIGATVIAMVPISLGGLGLREEAAVRLWGMMGVAQADAFGWAVAWRVVNWITALPGAVIYLLWRSSVKRPTDPIV